MSRQLIRELYALIFNGSLSYPVPPLDWPAWFWQDIAEVFTAP